MTTQPPTWDEDEFETQRQVAIERFRTVRMAEPLEDYLSHFEVARSAYEDLLELTVDLSQINENAVDALTAPNLLEAVRYLAGPPISADDLKTLTDASLAPGKLRADPDMARTVVETVLLGLDRNRFPWVAENRDPTEAERAAAAMASAALIAARKVMTARANESKTEQEEKVKDRLRAEGLVEVPTRTIITLSDAPGLGEFCGESLFGGRKADVVVRLWDGRVLPLECKVSNSSTNSVKRLNNDAAAKAETWLKEFGTAQTVPAAMLEGVFKTHNLVAAQKKGLTIFWAHDLEQFIRVVSSTRP